ncbi:MAG: sigma-70 family RNA polymerase sigma factor [Roseibium sp.]|uniref:RNA polymerase sigma factor n=1 Tax=Roseibium sp. TaxID=1936156 RepID=UPI001B1CBBEE|nr:sigma-70 family RNA polymerase sigma factor [Roseibium sp.]MBO6891622.1 sigma-70 family RNA polymerase sigma factor [Roseibium sp.]MBO6933047.1 sigma-70 family RNA polymerase sigma factor [Roseibium sp.]
MSQFDPSECVASALHAHRGELRRYLASRVPSEDVEDVLQIAALRAIERSEDLRDPALVLNWLYRVHANIVVDLGRKKASERRLQEAMALEAEPVERSHEPNCRCSVAQARQLGKNYASILDLVDISGKSIAHAARTLNISVNNATVRLHRARAALKKRLQEHCGVTSPSACNDCKCSYEGCCGG